MLTARTRAWLTATAIALLLSGSYLLDGMTHIEDGVRVFTPDSSIRTLPDDERAAVEEAFEAYLETIPTSKRFDRELFYDLRDAVGKSGFGIGSAGLPAYNLLVEGYSQALDNDVVLSMKQANVPALSRTLPSDMRSISCSSAYPCFAPSTSAVSRRKVGSRRSVSRARRLYTDYKTMCGCGHGALVAFSTFTRV